MGVVCESKKERETRECEKEGGMKERHWLMNVRKTSTGQATVQEVSSFLMLSKKKKHPKETPGEEMSHLQPTQIPPGYTA